MRIRILIKVMKICNTGLQTLYGSIVNIQGSIVNLHSSRDHSDADPALNFDADPDLHFILMRIRFPTRMRIRNTDSNKQI
jgi:hypothetical protein